MRLVCWNMRRAKRDSPGWAYLDRLGPDIAVLQEVSSFPASLASRYAVSYEKAARKDGTPQSFGNLTLVRGTIEGRIPLVSDLDWVNRERDQFGGAILADEATTRLGPIGIVNLHAPAWAIPGERLAAVDVTGVKLEANPRTYCTEIAWKLFRDTPGLFDRPLVVAGDFNSSETFDDLWGKSPRGNREVIERMNALGLHDALRTRAGKLVPTYRGNRGKQLVHQLDHVYIGEELIAILEDCQVGSREEVFDSNLSDHLPIIVDFRS